MKSIWVLISLVVVVILSSCSQTKDREQKGEFTKSMTVQDSIELLSQQILEDSANYTLYLKRARLNLNNGQIDPAFRDVSLSMDINKDDPEAYLILSDIYFLIGQAENSTSSLKKALELDPENIEIMLKLARTNLMLKNYEASSGYINYVLSLDVENPDAYYLRGIQKLENNDTVSGLVDLKIAGNLDTTFYTAFIHTGTVLSMLGDSTAINYYSAAVRAKPLDERALYLLALSYQENEKFDEALKTYDLISRKYPENGQAVYNMGYIQLVELGNYEEAILLFQQTIVIIPDFVEAVYNLGRAYEANGMYEEARVQYRQALELRTNYNLAIDGLNRLDEIQYPNQ